MGFSMLGKCPSFFFPHLQFTGIQHMVTVELERHFKKLNIAVFFTINVVSTS